jgi:predicted MPP superfamily phosphohydrolase
MILGNHDYNVYAVNKKNKRGSVQIKGWEDID